MKQILVDIDGVLLNWPVGVKNFAEKIIDDLPPMPESEFFRVEDWLGFSKEEGLDFLEAFHSDKEFSKLPAWTDAISVVNKLSKNGFNFHAITAAGTSDITKDLRRDNLELHYPNVIQDLHFVEVFDSKYDILKEYDKSYWIEDTPKHAIDGAKVGHLSFFLNRGRAVSTVNMDEMKELSVFQVESWNEIEKIILS